MKGPITFLAALLLATTSLAQTKYEREYRLKRERVPSPALEFVGTPDTKIKWYYEENLEGNSVEAKFDLDGKFYSVEFDTLGTLEDIEIDAEINSLPGPILEKIREGLQGTYTKFVLRRLQLQYSNGISSFSDFLNVDDPAEQYELRYEFVVKAKKDSHWKLYEIIFGRDGDIERTSEIIFRNTDNLEF